MDNPLTGWWFGTSSMFPYIGNFIIPTDVHSFFSEGFKPPTRYTDMKIIIIHNFSGLHYFRILKSPLFMDNPSTNACFFYNPNCIKRFWQAFDFHRLGCQSSNGDFLATFLGIRLTLTVGSLLLIWVLSSVQTRHMWVVSDCPVFMTDSRPGLVNPPPWTFIGGVKPLRSKSHSASLTLWGGQIGVFMAAVN